MKTIFVLFLITLSLFSCGKGGSGQDGGVVSVEQSKLLQISAVSGLNMRKTASLKADILKLIPNKSKVKLLKVTQKLVLIGGKKGHWVLVEFKGLQGWVFDAFLRK